MPGPDDPTDSDESAASTGAGDGAADAADGDPTVDDETVVRTAAEAAEDVVFSRFDTAEVSDLDVTVSFEDGVLDFDVYLDAEGRADPERVTEDAALAAQGAVDDLLE